MSVLIRSMKMPKECGECPLYSSIDDVCQFDQTDTCYDKKRPWWCPLVEVSEPHGRLIDVDEICFSMTNGTDQDIAEEAIIESTTVIEAEGE